MILKYQPYLRYFFARDKVMTKLKSRCSIFHSRL